jgi:hypothetical protein
MRKFAVLMFAVFVLAASAYAAEAPDRFKAAVREITVFKNGLALIAWQGEAEPNDGWVFTTDMPEPLEGTFWAFALGGAKAVETKAEFRETETTAPCMNIPEILRANTGKSAILTVLTGEGKTRIVSGTLLPVAEKTITSESAVGGEQYYDYRSSRYINNPAEIAALKSTAYADVVGVKSASGAEYVRIADVTGVSITGEPAVTVSKKENTRTLSIKVTGAAGRAKVGFSCMQRGIRWIPSYKITRISPDKVRITLSATLINDAVDLENVKCHLVVGVPNFILKDQLSAMALREFMARLSSYFSTGGRGRTGDTNMYSNAMMSQTNIAGPSLSSGGGGGESAAGSLPEDPSGRVEDLYLYHRDGITLKKGGRLTFQIFEAECPCEDRYVWNIPPVPPSEMFRNMDSDRMRELSSAYYAAKARHVLRITNQSGQPLTTGPALILSNESVLGQELMTYTSAGAGVELPITTAVDISVQKTERETSRVPNVTINDHNFTRVASSGTLTVTNRKQTPVKLTIRRAIFGKATAAPDGKIETLHSLEESFAPSADYWAGGFPYLYYGYWPWWFWGVNQVTHITWEAELKSGETREFKYDYEYHYYQ